MGAGEGIALLRISRPGVAATEPVMDLRFAGRFLAWLRRVIAPLFSSQKYELYECDEVRLLPGLSSYPDIHVETFDGSLAIPDEVARIVQPRPGESITVVTIARRIVAYARAVFKSTHAPECEVLVQVKPGEAFLSELRVLAPYRGIGLSRYLLISAARHLLEQGFSKVFIGKLIESKNHRQEMERTGFRTALEVTAYKILGQRINVLTHKA